MPADPASIGTGTLPAGTHGYTKLCLLPVVLAAGFEGLAWLTGDFWLHLMAVLALATLVAACIDDPRIKGLLVMFGGPTTATVGDQVTHWFAVTNTGRRATTSCHLRSHAHGYSDVTVLVPALAGGERVSVKVVRTATDRVAVAGHVVVVTSTAPFGLRSIRSTLALQARLVVRPRLVRVPGACLDPARASDDLGPSRLRRDGETVHGVRDWRSGDDARQIHWRSTARRGQLVVLERENPEQPRATFVVAGPAADPAWEHSVAVLASSVVEAVRAGAAVSLWAEQQGLAPLPDATADGALDWCAALTDPAWPSVELLVRAARAAGPGGLLQVCGPTTFAPEVWATVRTYVAPYGVDAVPLRTTP